MLDSLVDPRDAARQLRVELDLQAQVVDGVGVAQRVLVADLLALVQLEQRLVERDHALLARALHHFLDLLHLALEDEVGDQRVVDQQFDGRDPALAVLQWQQALREQGAQIEG